MYNITQRVLGDRKRRSGVRNNTERCLSFLRKQIWWVQFCLIKLSLQHIEEKEKKGSSNEDKSDYAADMI